MWMFEAEDKSFLESSPSFTWPVQRTGSRDLPEAGLRNREGSFKKSAGSSYLSSANFHILDICLTMTACRDVTMRLPWAKYQADRSTNDQKILWCTYLGSIKSSNRCLRSSGTSAIFFLHGPPTFVCWFAKNFHSSGNWLHCRQQLSRKPPMVITYIRKMMYVNAHQICEYANLPQESCMVVVHGRHRLKEWGWVKES